jgi:outer membrane protein assembly complex protein YaeT
MYRALQRLALLGLLAVPAVADAQSKRNRPDPDQPEITKLRLSGVRAVERNELEKSIATSQSKCRGLLYVPLCAVMKPNAIYERQYLDRTELKRDVLRIKVFYFKRGFRDTDVDTTIALKGEKAEVTFRITEGPPTIASVVRVERPNEILSDRQLRRLVLLRAGQPLDLLKLDSTVVRLRQAVWEQGYADAELAQQVDIATGSRAATVAITINPKWRATVGNIGVIGNQKVSEQTIRNSLTFGSGDVFKFHEIAESQRNLYESSLFKRAAIAIIPPSDSGPIRADSIKDVRVNVTEAPLREARLASGLNTREFLQVEGRFTHYNFQGRARRVDIQGSIGNLLAPYLNNRGVFSNIATVEGAERGRFLAPTWQVSADVQQRWFQSPRNTIGGSVFAHRRATPGIFIDHGQGTSATFTREISPRAPVSLNYRFEITSVEAGDVYFCVNFGVCDRETISALRGNQRLSPAILTGSWDRTDNPIGPRRGYSLHGELEHASAFTVSDFRYNRSYLEGMVYRPIGRGGVLAAHVKLGRVKALTSTAAATGAVGTEAEVLHPRKRFYAGGSQSVRGFGENQLGPRVLTIPATKLRAAATIGTGTTPDTTLACPTSTPIESCPVNGFGLEDRDFTPRPMGGNALIEGSIEFRMPIWRDDFVGAVFLDGAFVGQGALRTVTKGAGAVTPGVGFRYRSPVGPIRIDVGYAPKLSELLPVITESTDSLGRRVLVKLQDPREPDGVARRLFKNGRGFFDRLTLHFSIGEAF